MRKNLDIPFVLAGSFCAMACPMLLTPIITGFSGHLGASSLLMGLVGGLTNLCALFLRPLMGNLADKLSKYHLVLSGSLFSLITCLICIFAVNPGMVVLARIIHGAGFACCSVCMATWLSALLPKEKIGSGMGLYGAMNALAMAVAPAIGVYVQEHWGYRPAFVIAAFFAAMIGVFAHFVKDRGHIAPPDPTKKEKLRLVDIHTVPIALIIMLFATPYCATQSFLVSFVNAKQISVTVSLFFPLYAFFLLIVRMALRQYFDRLHFAVFLWGGSLCALISLSSLSLMRGNLLMAVAAAFMSGGYGIMSSVCQSKALLLAEDHHRGLANSTYYIGLDLGMTLGPVLGGALYGGVPLSLFYPLLILCVPAALLVYYVSQKFHRWS